MRGRTTWRRSYRPRPPTATRRWLAGFRPFLLLVVLLVLGAVLDPALVEPVGILSTDAERVSATFTPCGPGRGDACVIDGDTFKLGNRKVRIIGIDTPELNGQCAAERRLAAEAATRLRQLLNQGPFTMTGHIGELQDRYGRDLRTLTRERPDGSVQNIAADMRESGLARRYLGAKASWC